MRMDEIFQRFYEKVKSQRSLPNQSKTGAVRMSDNVNNPNNPNRNSTSLESVAKDINVNVGTVPPGSPSNANAGQIDPNEEMAKANQRQETPDQPDAAAPKSEQPTANQQNQNDSDKQ